MAACLQNRMAHLVAFFSLACLASLQAAPDPVAQVPLSLSEGVPPNIILSLDESGSMSWSFVPDASHQVYQDKIGAYNSRRMRAVNANPLAYDPGVIYQVPPAFGLDGSELVLATSFTAAPLNGFWLPAEHGGHAGRGRQDLRTNYRLAREHRLGATRDGGTLNWADHPADFSCTARIARNNFSHSCGEQVRFRITRTTANSCSAVMELPDGRRPAANCSGSNGAYTADVRKTGVPAYYYEFEPGRPGCSNKLGTHDEGGEDCHSIRFVTAESAHDASGRRLRHADGRLVDGRENFAVWYSFYRSRALATLSAASIAFYDLSQDVRLTWQNLDSCTSFDSNTSGSGVCGDNRLKPYTARHRGEFYSWLRRIYFNKGTPLPQTMYRAGEYLRSETPWQRYPHGIGGSNDAANTHACRPSYHVLMTDGMWNRERELVAGVRTDESSFQTPGGQLYSPQKYAGQHPFHGASKNTLADYAMHYWASDLRPQLDNRVSPHMPYRSGNDNTDYWDPRNNPAEWQHMSNFIMGLGLGSSLEKLHWSGSTHAGAGYAALADGSRSWPVPASGSQNNVSDLWHAAINSRGEFHSVDRPQAMVQAFRDILVRISRRSSHAAMPGISTRMEATAADNSERLITNFYQTSYDSTDWSGDVQQISRYRNFDAASGTFTTVEEVGKSAAENLPAHDKRNIQVASPAGGLMAFTIANAGEPESAGSLASFFVVNPETGDKTGSWQERLNHVRGDRSKEGVGGLRNRSSVLGDFFASQPVVVAGARYLAGMANELEGNTAYSSFMQQIRRRPALLYVGGNAGMLHAFDASTMVEKFAFVPTAVLPRLSRLTGNNYNHEFYVDGSPVVADVYDKNTAVWRTILVGSLRAGGKGLFALDVTEPGMDGSGIKLLWELHEGNFPASINGVAASVGLGYSFPQPTVARLHDGNWAVITGNGYKAAGSNNGKAALFVINAMTGKLIKSLEVQSPVSSAENGLSTPTLADFDGDGVADYAYAGDLHGNLWRFDLLGAGKQAAVDGSSAGSYGGKNDREGFRVSYGGRPLFMARSGQGNMQPIMAAPTLVRHPSRTGYLVAFGTGKYFENGDKTGDGSNRQTVYAVWDMHTKAQDTDGSMQLVQRADLQRQQLTAVSGGKGTGQVSGRERQVRGLSSEQVEWFHAADKGRVNRRGWYFDLDMQGADGEMVIEKMQLLGNTLFVQTLVPNSDPCASGVSNWLYAVNASTGGQTAHHAFDTKGPNGEIIAAIRFGSEGGVVISQDETGFKANAPADEEAVAPDPDSLGRQSWRMMHDA